MRDQNISKFIRLVASFPILPVVADGKAYDLFGRTVINIRELYEMISKYLEK